jgi:dihydrofolate reductase
VCRIAIERILTRRATDVARDVLRVAVDASAPTSVRITHKNATPAGVLLGSGMLATEPDRLDLIDEYKFLVHPRIAGHGPTLYQSGLPGTRRLELVSAKPLRNGAVAMHYRRAR